MKIGFSFGRCVRDIVNGHVHMDDVMCIIARTFMPKEEDVLFVIQSYLGHRGYLLGLDPIECEDVGLTLWRTGRVIEPRSNGVGVMQVPSDAVWMDLYPTVVGSKNESVKVAWESYRMLIGLAEQLPEVDQNSLCAGVKHEEQDPANRIVPPMPTDEEIAEHKRALDLLASSI